MYEIYIFHGVNPIIEQLVRVQLRQRKFVLNALTMIKSAIRTSWLLRSPYKLAACGLQRRNSSTLPLDEDVTYFGRKKQTQVSLKALMETGVGKRLSDFDFDTPKRSSEATDRVKIQIACFLHRELPIRLAHQVLELETTTEFRDIKPIMNIAGWYRSSFAALRDCPAPTDIVKEEAFSRVVSGIFERHSHTLINMALGAHMLRQALSKAAGSDREASMLSFAENVELQQRLDAFYLSRIGIRMLIGQYLALRHGSQSEDPLNEGMIGLISERASPYVGPPC
jgi:pyruvate dehydrogenase kinase 2/3/4